MSQSHAAPSRADAAYHNDSYSLQQTLLSCARRGDTRAQHALITQCHPPITRYAARLTCRLQHSSCEDLVSEGMLVVVERLDEALSKPNPIAWLLVSARYHMQRYAQTRDPLIRYPDTMLSHPERATVPYRIDSLEAPLSRTHEDDGEARTLADVLAAPVLIETSRQAHDYISLYNALDRLSPRRRTLVMQRYGLDLDADSDAVPSIEAQTPRQRHLLHKELGAAKKLLAKWMTQASDANTQLGGAA